MTTPQATDPRLMSDADWLALVARLRLPRELWGEAWLRLVYIFDQEGGMTEALRDAILTRMRDRAAAEEQMRKDSGELGLAA